MNAHSNTMKKTVLISIIVLGLTFSLNTINACNETNSSNWTNITIDGVNFKLPPEYEGGHFTGEENHTGYMLETVFDFSINSMYSEARLREEYGFESTIEELTSFDEEIIGNHNVILLHSYRSICGHNVTYAFFVVNKTIFSLSYNGINLTANLKDMINSTPKSELSKKEFLNQLDEAQTSYLEAEKEYDENYAYSEFYRSKMDKTKHNKGYDFASMYIAYRLGQHFMNNKH